MKFIRGYKASREFLEKRQLQELAPSAAVLARLNELFGRPITPQEAVAEILAYVRTRGDAALREYTARIDGVTLPEFEVSYKEIAQAYQAAPPDVIAALELAAERIRRFHEAHLPKTWIDKPAGWGQLVRPLDRVGIYVPGGRAAYPSTVLMTAVPAKVASVPEIIVVTPPDRQGNANSLVLAAAKIAGVDRVFKAGGAQAIGALAYGTESIPRVDKICGPGNLFVVLAKRAVYGTVGIDGLHGPTEGAVLADDSADPRLCAADLLAQAEHDELASAIFITDSERLLNTVEQEVERQLAELDRSDVIRGALNNNGLFILVETLSQGADLANILAPEHLSILTRDPWSLTDRVRHAGALFVGSATSAALGDYVAGPSHVMPTGATARFSSPLHADDFVKVTSVVGLDASASSALAPAAATIARAEGLTAHAKAVEMHQQLTAQEIRAQ